MTAHHITAIRVRYAETDKMGIAYNSHYLTWFEVGRTEMIRSLGYSYDDLERFGYRLPLIEAGVRYLKPVRYDDVIDIVSFIESQRGIRMRIGYELRRGDDLLATGFTEHVFTDPDLRPVRPPRDLRLDHD